MAIIKETYNNIKKFRDFIITSVKAELMLDVSRSVIGYVWWILDPILYMGIYIFVVSFIFDKGAPNYPVFVFSGLLIWRWTSAALTESTGSIIAKKNLLDQIYIPKFILPLIKIITNTIYYFFSLLILFLLLIVYKVPFTLHFFEIIPIILVQAFFLFGLGLWFSHLGVYFYDFDKYIRFILRLWYYVSPGLYTIDSVPEKFRPFIWINPLTTTMEGSRAIFLEGQSPNYLALFLLFGLSLILIYTGLLQMKKFDRSYTKVI